MKKMTFLLFFIMMTTLFPKGSFFYNFRTFKRILFQLFYMIKNEVSYGIYILCVLIVLMTKIRVAISVYS